MKCAYLEDVWVSEMVDSLALMHPDMTIADLTEFVREEYEASYTDHKCSIYNSYENTVADTTLGGVLDWIQKEKPLIAESGVFFYPKHVKRNVNIEIIKECMLDARTIHKNEMFEAKKAGDTFTQTVKNLQQLNDKKAANSGYGAEGQSSSFLFNINSAMSVTASGRGQLSTAMLCFENLFGDYVKFFDMDDFHHYIWNILHEETHIDVYDVIEFIPNKKTWVKRFTDKFLHVSLYDQEQIELVYDSLTEPQIIRTYYKANLRDFFRYNRLPTMLMDRITNISEDFVDPNEPPEAIQDLLGQLNAIVTEFICYKHSFFRYEDRARYQKRAVVCVADTDSNMLNYGPLLEFMKNEVLPTKLSLKAKKEESFTLKVLNTLSTFASSAVAATLWNYLGYVNVAKEDRPRIKMKNEFYYLRMIVTFAKKSYIALMTRREQVVLKTPELDVKGVNFFKSTASKETSDFIYEEMLMNQLLQPKSGKVSLQSVYKSAHDFQKYIADEIKRGNMGFLKRSVKVKSADAYADPLRISQYSACYVWNYIAPDNEQITFPNIVTLVKVKLQTKKDAAALAPWPHIYEKIIELFDTNDTIGDHMVYDSAKGKDRLVKGRGINAIALPPDSEEVPDWMLAIIDVETLVSDNMSLFTQLFKPLGFVPGKVTHRGTTQQYYTSIVRI
ncbi:MAG: hypothetical protein NC489_08550 [Ruminococcus flavefaciens]|nr:hypothetical protein [Ruminococcus flavefaciens]